MPISSSSSSSTSNARAAQNSRPAVQSERNNARPVDERVLRLLEAYRPWETLDGMVLTIIDQTYAALLEILGLDGAPPAGDGPVKATHLVEPPDDANLPGLPPVHVVVDASATHCSVRLIDGGPEYKRPHSHLRQSEAVARQRQRQRQHGVNHRASATASLGVIHLARAAAAAGDEGGQVTNRWKKAVGDDIRPDVSEKGLLGVLDAMRAHMDRAIRLVDGVVDMARAGGCRSRIRATDVIRVRTTLGQMRREVDINYVRRRFRRDRCMVQKIINRRRPAAKMDVDKVDEEDVLTKRLKGLHVVESASSEATHGEQGNNASN